ncbi:MAG: hypothetical protein FWE48_06670 [Coriobacteriia bacterium]|nr:hypothetical protein [Coriobacteriia bacterium]
MTNLEQTTKHFCLSKVNAALSSSFSVRALLFSASIMVLSVLLLAACTPSQEPSCVQQESSLLSTEVPVEATTEIAELVETGGVKEAVSIEAFVAAAEGLPFETLPLVEIATALNTSEEELQRAEKAGEVRIAGVVHHDLTVIVFFEWMNADTAKIFFTEVRNESEFLFGDSSGDRGQNYERFSMVILDGISATIRVENTVIMADGTCSAISTLLETIGYQ